MWGKKEHYFCSIWNVLKLQCLIDDAGDFLEFLMFVNVFVQCIIRWSG